MAVLTPLRPTLNPGADAERLQRSLRGWRRRSQVIGGVRRLLPLFMAAVVAGLGWWVWRETRGTEAPVAQGQVPIRMLNPVFRGRDDGRPFVLQASEAVRDGKDYQRVALVAPRMEIQEAPGEPPTRITAERGVYREDTLILDLEGDVRYTDAAGWKFLTNNAVVDTKRDTVTGNRGIRGDGPAGLFFANSYVIFNQGDRVILRGNVKTISERR